MLLQLLLFICIYVKFSDCPCTFCIVAVLTANVWAVVQGRHVLWGWLQERRKVGSYDYAGCLSLPRIMYISGNRLIQVTCIPFHLFHVSMQIPA